MSAPISRRYHSVTRHFYDRGWRGVNVEPVARICGLLRDERPGDVNLELALSDREGSMTLYEPAGSLGMSTLSVAFADGLRRDGYACEERTVPVTTLAKLCEAHVGDRTIDFLKVDVEGHEAAVLRGGDWRRWRPRVVLVEATVIPEAWEPGLLAAGYLPATTDGVNRYYLRDEDAGLLPRLTAPLWVTDAFIPFEAADALRSLEEQLQGTRAGLDARPLRRLGGPGTAGPVRGPRAGPPRRAGAAPGGGRRPRAAGTAGEAARAGPARGAAAGPPRRLSDDPNGAATRPRPMEVRSMLDANVPEVLRRIGPRDRVLDVGGWGRCFNRADAVIDKHPYETRGTAYAERLGLGPQGGDVRAVRRLDLGLPRPLRPRALALPGSILRLLHLFAYARGHPRPALGLLRDAAGRQGRLHRVPVDGLRADPGPRGRSCRSGSRTTSGSSRSGATPSPSTRSCTACTATRA